MFPYFMCLVTRLSYWDVRSKEYSRNADYRLYYRVGNCWMTRDFSILPGSQVPWLSTALPITKRVLTYRSLNDPCPIKWEVSGTAVPDWITSLRSLNRMPFNQRKALTHVGVLSPKRFPFCNMLLLCKALESDCLGLDSDSTTPLAVWP